MITYRNKNGALQIQRKIGNCIIRRIIHNDKFGVDDFFLVKFDNHPVYGNFGLRKRNFDIKEMSSWYIKERKKRLGDKWRSGLHYLMSFVDEVHEKRLKIRQINDERMLFLLS